MEDNLETLLELFEVDKKSALMKCSEYLRKNVSKQVTDYDNVVIFDHIEITFVEEYYHGDGHDCYVIFSFSYKDKILGYLKYTGLFSSWDSTQWDDIPDVVEPKEVMVTKYFKVD